jgi:hypothetical protein
MARKICAKLILELRESGLSVNQIAQTRHISKHSVSDVFRIAQEQGIRFRDIQFMEPDEVYRLIYPDKHVNETMYDLAVFFSYKLPSITLENICLFIL